MPKNGAKTGKSSKTARVLSLLTDPAASLLGGSRNHKDDEETEALDERKAPGLDDAATESRIQASLAAEEDSLVTELFGKPNAPSRTRRAPAPEPPQESAAPAPQQPDAQEPDPRTLELLSMLSNPSTLGNSAMPSYADEEPLRPAALEKDFADELTEGLSPQPAPQYDAEAEARAEAEWASQAAPSVQQPAQPAPQPMRREEPPSVQQPAPPAQQAPQPAQVVRQEAQASVKPYAPPPINQPAPSAPQPVQQAPQPVRQAAQPVQQAAPRPATERDNDHFVCFNLTQALVEDKADKLMRQFGMCTCNRCKVDVTAIALSNLPAKYVAMQNRDILPLLSMYEERYSAAVTVQVMNACRMVMKRPHHGR